jgi:DNA-binding response OmpR family regulator
MADDGIHKGTRTVLLVEDDRQLIRVLTIALTAAGFEVAAAPSNREAVTAVQERPIEGVVLDTRLSDGIARPTLEWLIRRRDDGHQLPVWIVTSSLDENEVVSVLGPLRGPFLPKPFDPWRLVGMLEELLRGARLDD